MAIHYDDIVLLMFYVKLVFGKKYKNLKMLELGDQCIWKNKEKVWKFFIGDSNIECNSDNVIICKKFFSKLGFDHTSYDINNKNGAEKVNISSLIQNIDKKYDIITDYGTVEHVGQYCSDLTLFENPQYNCFKNIHNLLKINGIVVHCIPAPNNWPKHGLFEYSLDFFKNLAIKNNYKILDLKYVNNYTDNKKDKRWLCFSVLQKQDNSEFITLENFKNIKGLINTGFINPV